MKVFQTQFFKGSMLDRISGSALTPSNVTFARSENGLSAYFNGSNAKITIGNKGNLKTVAFYMRLKTTSEKIFEGDPNAHLIYANAGTLTYPDFDNAFVDTVDTDTIDTKWHSVVITSSTAVNCTDIELALNNASYGNLFIAEVIGDDEEWNSDKIEDFHKKFLKPSNLSETKRHFDHRKNVADDLSNEAGIVSAYNFKEAGSVDTDIAGSNDATTTGALLTYNGKNYNGVDDNSVMGNIGNVKSIAFRIKLKTTTEQILEGSANDKLIHINAGTLTYSDYDNAFINGADTNTITAGVWNNVVITSSTDVDNSALTLALNNASYGAFEISDLRFYSDEKDLAFAKEYNNYYAKQVYIQDNLKYDKADGTVLVPEGWDANGTGSYKITDIPRPATMTDAEVHNHDIKLLENTVAGIIAFQSEQAYGTWEFDLYKGTDNKIPFITFIGANKNIYKSNDGYMFWIGSGESLLFNVIHNGLSTSLYTTTTSYISINTLYSFKITRSLNGVFTFYIKGGSFGNSFVLVDSSGGSGTNPVVDNTYTTSKYFVVDTDAGDMIGRFLLKEGIIIN